MHDMLIIPIAFQHFRAEPEEIRRRQTVVFQNDPFLFLFEKPADAVRRRFPAAQIPVAETGLHFAGPVHPVKNRPDRRAACRIRFAIPRTVGGNIEFFRRIFPNRVKDYFRGFRTIEHDHQNWKFSHLVILFCGSGYYSTDRAVFQDRLSSRAVATA